VKLDNTKEKKKILIRAPNWIGDGVLSMPAVEAVKKAFHRAELTIMTRPWVAPLYFNNPHVDGIIEYDTTGKHKGLTGKWKLIDEMKEREFDLVILFQNAFEAALLSFLARIPVRVGYSRDLRAPLLTHAIDVDPRILESHEVFYYLNLLERVGIETDNDPKPTLSLTPEEENRADETIKNEGMAGDLIAGMAPGASYGPAKRWGIERFAEVADMLIHQCNAKIICFGDRGDFSICQEIVNKVGSKALNFAGKANLRQFIALLNCTSLFITNDSGPMHIAAALDIPTIALFGSTDHTRTGPVSKNAVVITKSVECSPCFKRTCHRGDYKCLNDIKVSDVFRNAMEIMKEKGMKKYVQRSCLF
jgi:heptosyltransferase-2